MPKKRTKNNARKRAPVKKATVRQKKAGVRKRRTIYWETVCDRSYGLDTRKKREAAKKKKKTPTRTKSYGTNKLVGERTTPSQRKISKWKHHNV